MVIKVILGLPFQSMASNCDQYAGIIISWYSYVSSMCKPQAIRTSALLLEIVILYKYAYVAVPGRNRTLFRCIF